MAKWRRLKGDKEYVALREQLTQEAQQIFNVGPSARINPGELGYFVEHMIQHKRNCGDPYYRDAVLAYMSRSLLHFVDELDKLVAQQVR